MSVVSNDPFGTPDGAFADITETRNSYVRLSAHHHGGIGRSPEDASIRVVAGGLGTGKSLFMRMMRDHIRADPSRYAAEYTASSEGLSSKDVVAFSQVMGPQTANSEAWNTLWRRAIVRAAASHFTSARSRLAPNVDPRTLLDLKKRWPELLPNQKSRRTVTVEAAAIIRAHARHRTSLDRFLNHPEWQNIESVLSEALGDSQPLFLYVDAIDDNFKWAPAYWLRCQRGLFYCVMDMMRSGAAGRRLHVVIAIRDVVLASVRSSEHALRYLDTAHVNVLNWSVDALKEFLDQKIANLDPVFILDPELPGVAGMLGRASVSNGRSGGKREAIDEYLIRHTLLTPRGVILMGNALSRLSAAATIDRRPLEEDEIRRCVSESAYHIAQAALANVANQVISDSMPDTATHHGFADVFVNPNDYQTGDAIGVIVDLIKEAGCEVIDHETLGHLNKLASEQYDADIPLGHILWQNRLLGGRTSTTGWEFFSAEGPAESNLPKEFREFVFHPILLDRVRGLEPTLPEPAYPHR